MTSTLEDETRDIDVASFCDVQKTVRVVSSEIRCISAQPKFAGLAHLVIAKGDFLGVLKGLKDARPGDVLVVTAGGERLACAGELVAQDAAGRGLAGLIIDGYCRDAALIAGLDFPVYARGFTPMAGSSNKLFDAPDQVAFGGVTVRQHEIVLGDADGMIVMSEEEYRRNLPNAHGIQEAEAKVKAAMADGKSLLDVTNFDEHVAAVAGQGSKFGFK